MSEKKEITVEADVNAPIAKAWEHWTKPEHIVHWNNASDEWHTPKAENDFRPGGRFVCRMEAKDGSMGFDFGGTNNIIDEHKYIEYTLDDDRKVKISFSESGEGTHISETFEAEDDNPLEMQQSGWQAILYNFKKYSEAQTQEG